MVAVQPCALLMVIGPDWQVETVSANVAMLGNHRPTGVVGQPLADLIGSKAIHTLRNRLSWLSSDESEVQDFGVEWGGVMFDIRATRDEGCYLIEAELAVEPRLPDGIGMVRSMSDRLTGNQPVELAGQAMRLLHSLIGFERVVLCDERGEVIASNQKSDTTAISEVVKLARLIADRDAEQVPLVGNEDNEVLSRAAYVAPASEEVERLAGLGIAATMSLPLRIDGDLVGSLHASNSAPKRIGAERRSVAHLFAERLVARMARRGWGEYSLTP
jgi:light-regulated signal transduction histidine kinase (bacteriophytochrome)